ncbi:MAG: matrixin family metalloprotease [Bdellovibrionales bacterium]
MPSYLKHPSLFIIAVLLLVASCSRPLPPQESCNFVQNPEQQRVSWKAGLPVKMFVHSSVPVEAYAAIDRAVEEYNQTLGGGREIIRIVAKGVDGDLSPKKDGRSMIYWFNSWDPDKPTEQARTTIYWSGIHIFEADIRINAHNFKLYLGEAHSFANLDLTSLLVHELGHVLGLAHNSTSGSVMNFSLNDGQDRRKLSTTDLNSLRCEY